MTDFRPPYPVDTGDDALDRKLESMAAFARRFDLPEDMSARCSLETREGHGDNDNDWLQRNRIEEAMQELEGLVRITGLRGRANLWEKTEVPK